MTKMNTNTQTTGRVLHCRIWCKCRRSAQLHPVRIFALRVCTELSPAVGLTDTRPCSSLYIHDTAQE